MKKMICILIGVCLIITLLASCGKTDETTAVAGTYVAETAENADGTVSVVYTANTSGILGTAADAFTDRDLKQSAELADATQLTVENNKTLSVTAAGTYVISGTASNCTVRVEAGAEDKVQLVLNGVTVTNADFPVIYVVQADKCLITTAENTQNTLKVTGSFTADGDTNTDAVIFSKDDIVLNGLGTLTVVSDQGNGVSGKDGIRVTGGTLNITCAGDGIEANDSIAVCGNAQITVNASEDGFHAENEGDTSVGWILIAGGNVSITSKSDAVHATTALQMDNGSVTGSGREGFEGTYIQINGGTVVLTATDDGINAGAKSSAYKVTIEITGGSVTVTVGQGDTDAIDANGDIIVSGGYINVTAPTSSFDYDGTATYTGGTVIVNGETVNKIPQPAMGGGRR